jgi:hypothetical protein
MIAALQVKVDELEFEAQFYRCATMFVFLLVAERIWDRFF